METILEKIIKTERIRRVEVDSILWFSVYDVLRYLETGQTVEYFKDLASNKGYLSEEKDEYFRSDIKEPFNKQSYLYPLLVSKKGISEIFKILNIQ